MAFLPENLPPVIYDTDESSEDELQNDPNRLRKEFRDHSSYFLFWLRPVIIPNWEIYYIKIYLQVKMNLKMKIKTKIIQLTQLTIQLARWDISLLLWLSF